MPSSYEVDNEWVHAHFWQAVKMVYRKDAKGWFLTYPRFDIGLDDAWAEMVKLEPVPGAKVDKLLVARELHEDGMPHLHVYVTFKDRIRTNNMRAFDVLGKHPNVQTAKSPKHVIKYCLKDGNYKANFEVKIKASVKKMLIEAKKNATTKEEFLDMVIEEHAEFCFKHWNNFTGVVKHVFKGCRPYDPRRNLDDFAYIPEPVVSWMQDLAKHNRGERDMRALWIWGPSRLGKTELACSIGKHCYMQGVWNIKNISDTASYAVFDDFAWSSLAYLMRQLCGAQKNVTFTGKYAAPTTFTWGLPAIFLSNRLPELTGEEQEYFDENVTFVHITEKLY